MGRFDYIREIEYDVIREVRKFNPYHDSKGRFASSGGVAAGSASIKTDRYQELIPKNSYVKSPEYQKAREEFSTAQKRHNDLFAEAKKLEEDLENESSPKPKDQWTIDDEYNSLLGKRPKNYTEKGKQLKERMDSARKESIKAMDERDEAMKALDDIKRENHNKQAAEHEYVMPKKATQTEYEGFKTDDTGTSHGNSLLRQGYLAEMSPKEYLSRCAFEIFDGATIESTIHGTEAANVAKYTKMMQDGVKFDTPYLDYVGSGQEGRHRAMAAYNLGIEKIPVVVRDDPWNNAVTMKRKQNITSSRYDEVEELDDEFLLYD